MKKDSIMADVIAVYPDGKIGMAILATPGSYTDKEAESLRDVPVSCSPLSEVLKWDTAKTILLKIKKGDVLQSECRSCGVQVVLMKTSARFGKLFCNDCAIEKVLKPERPGERS